MMTWKAIASMYKMLRLVDRLSYRRYEGNNPGNCNLHAGPQLGLARPALLAPHGDAKHQTNGGHGQDLPPHLRIQLLLLHPLPNLPSWSKYNLNNRPSWT